MVPAVSHPSAAPRKALIRLAGWAKVRPMEWWAVGVALLLLLLFGGLALAVRRFAGASGLGGSQHIVVIGARRLDLNCTLYIVEVDGRRLLVGSGRDGARLVADLTADP